MSGAVRTNYYFVVYDVLEEIEGKLQKVLSPTPDGELVARFSTPTALRDAQHDERGLFGFNDGR